MNRPNSDESISRIRSPKLVLRTARVNGPWEFKDGSESADTVVRIDFTVEENRSMWSANADMVTYRLTPSWISRNTKRLALEYVSACPK